MMIILTVLIIIIGLILLGYLFLKLNPAFGRRASGETMEIYKQSGNYAKGRFMNATPTSMAMDPKTLISILRDYMRTNTNRKPARPIGTVTSAVPYAELPDQTVVRWFGHSALMLELEGKTLLIDPMFGKAPMPV
ncbi:hypothetical protein K0U00_11370, partial [Paenibacillus sepulcri]|nr:hypothetical protein [Paenibacillus sepulcri]